MSPFSSILQNRLQRYYKFFKYTRFLAKKYRLCSHKRSFLLKRLLFARKCGLIVPLWLRPYLRKGKRHFRLFSAFSPAEPKGCSKDDERVLKGCLCLCHPSHNLFFRRKLLYGTILFPKFSANLLLFFDICKFCTTVLSTFYIFTCFFESFVH